MKRAFVYCRVSTEEQSGDDRHSLPIQEERCREYAERKDWRVVKIRKDALSGRNAKRPGYQELLKDIETGEIDVVIVYRLDRLSRNVRDVYDFLQLTSDASVGFVSTSEQFDSTTAMGRAMLGVAAVFAQLTREMISENVRDGIARRARSGKYIGPKAYTPYGYRYCSDAGKLLVEPDQAEVVHKIFELYGQRKWGTTKIARYLNQQGIPAKMGGQWYNRAIGRMIRFPVYVGKLTYKGEVHDGDHEPILSQQLFDDAQELIQQRATLPPRSQQSRHLLAGIVRCGRCGARLSGHWVQHTTRPGGKRKYRMYRHRRNVDGRDSACPGLTKSAPKLEAVVIEKVRELAASPDFQEAAFGAAKQQVAAAGPGIAEERDAVVSQLAEMDARFDRWAEMLDSGSISERQFRKRNEKLVKDQQALQERSAELESQGAEAESIEVEIDQVKEMLGRFDEVWGNLTLDEQREMLRALVEELNIWKEKAELKLLFMPPMEIPLRFTRGPAPKQSAPAKAAAN